MFLNGKLFSKEKKIAKKHLLIFNFINIFMLTNKTHTISIEKKITSDSL